MMFFILHIILLNVFYSVFCFVYI